MILKISAASGRQHRKWTHPDETSILFFKFCYQVSAEDILWSIKKSNDMFGYLVHTHAGHFAYVLMYVPSKPPSEVDTIALIL